MYQDVRAQGETEMAEAAAPGSCPDGCGRHQASRLAARAKRHPREGLVRRFRPNRSWRLHETTKEQSAHAYPPTGGGRQKTPRDAILAVQSASSFPKDTPVPGHMCDQGARGCVARIQDAMRRRTVAGPSVRPQKMPCAIPMAERQSDR